MEAVDVKQTKEGRETFQASKLIVASKSFTTECDEMLLNLFVVHLINIFTITLSSTLKNSHTSTTDTKLK